jgi:hypothetical protein
MTKTRLIALTSVFAMAMTSQLLVSTPAKTQSAGLGPSEPISAARYAARTLYIRIAGVIPPIDSPSLTSMENLLSQGKKTEAARIAMQDPNFLNITIRNLAQAMSNRAKTANEPYNDFVATFLGVVRDDLSAKQLLTGNFFYAADATRIPAGVTVRQNVLTDILKSNNHYADIEARGLDLAGVLAQRPQETVSGATTTVIHPEPAGLLTTRQWGLAHLIAGTNRRAVEFTFSQFACIEINDFSDPTGPDTMVGRDVTRFPQGDNGIFQAKCRGCHTMLDGMRTAYVNYDFDDNFVKSREVLPPGGDDNAQMQLNAEGVPPKYSVNNTVFPQGYVVRDGNWVNNATSGINAAYFEWRSPLVGNGLQSFAAMIADSGAFSRCMVRRTFKTICNRELTTGTEDSLIRALGNRFETTGYNFKTIVAEIAAQPACLGL